MSTNGKISSFLSMSTLDGAGVRCVVFMQGCALRCGYCHNPETWDINGGETYSTDEIFARIQNCRAYFGKDGGVTVSGGEPLLQAAWVTELFRKCHENGINTCLDTAGSLWNDDIPALLEQTDLCLLDYKMTNESDYRKYTLCDIEKPRRFMAELDKRNIRTWIRHVVVGGINDSEQSISLLRKFVSEHRNIEKTELLPFHKMCHTKYEKLGVPFAFADMGEPDTETMDRLNSIFCGVSL